MTLTEVKNFPGILLRHVNGKENRIIISWAIWSRYQQPMKFFLRGHVLKIGFGRKVLLSSYWLIFLHLAQTENIFRTESKTENNNKQILENF